MAVKLKVWFDAEADFLEVRFSDAPGYEKETDHDAVCLAPTSSHDSLHPQRLSRGVRPSPLAMTPPQRLTMRAVQKKPDHLTSLAANR
jgi:hypothetical protein